MHASAAKWRQLLGFQQVVRSRYVAVVLAATKFISPVDLNAQTPTDLVFSSNYTFSSGTSGFTASNSITAGMSGGTPYTFVVNGSASVSLLAGNVISLEPGFHATAGSAASFRASLATPVTITTTQASLPTGVAGAPYPATGLAATGGIPGYTWSVTSGQSPLSSLGLSISSVGIISGLPTAFGSASFTVQASDSTPSPNTRSATAGFTITVGAGSLSITSTALPSGPLGAAYGPQPLSARGGSAPYTWSVSAGALPAGLSLNSSAATISGTPTAAGTSNFTLKVTDNNGATATAGFSLTIAPMLSSCNSASKEYIQINGRVAAIEATLGPVALAGQSTWVACAVGTADPNDSASAASGTLTVGSRGTGIGLSADSFVYVFGPTALTGDGAIYARLVTADTSNSSFNYGVMLRSGLQPGDTNVYLGYRSAQTVFLSSRTAQSGTTTTQTTSGSQLLPKWLKLVRSGSTVTAYKSPDGASWEQVGSGITFGTAPVYGGIAAAGTASATAAATFDDSLTTTGTNPDFELTGPVTKIPGYANGSVGGARTDPIAISGLNGFTGTVSLSISGLPSGVTSSLNTTTIAGGSGRAYLTLTVPASLAAGDYPFTITATSGSLTHTDGPILSVSNSNYPGQANWLVSPVQDTDSNNSASFSSGALSIAARGTGIGQSNGTDSFYYVYEGTPQTGDGSLSARLVTADSTNNAFAYTLMLRSGFQPWDTEVSLSYTNTAIPIDLRSRTTEGGSTTTTPVVSSPPGLPLWLKLARSGSSVSAYTSTDGATWTQRGSSVTLSAPQLYFGIAVTGTSAATASATFDNIIGPY